MTFAISFITTVTALAYAQDIFFTESGTTSLASTIDTTVLTSTEACPTCLEPTCAPCPPPNCDQVCPSFPPNCVRFTCGPPTCPELNCPTQPHCPQGTCDLPTCPPIDCPPPECPQPTVCASTLSCPNGGICPAIGVKGTVVERGRLVEVVKRRCRGLACVENLGCQPIGCPRGKEDHLNEQRSVIILAADIMNECDAWRTDFGCGEPLTGVTNSGKNFCRFEYPCTQI